MTGLPTTRRQLMGVTAALLGLTAASRVSAAPRNGAVFILDGRLPEAAALEARARMAGHVTADPEGEMVRLLLEPKDKALMTASTIIGLSTYSDFVLARDVLRTVGRTPRAAMALPMAAGEAPEPLLDLLHQSCQRRCASRATSYLWLA